MAEIGATTPVVTVASMLGMGSTAHADLPMVGICESAVSGPPPTAVVVNWPNGTSTTYAVSGAGATAVLYQLTNPPSGTLLLGSVVAPTEASGIPNPGGRVQGPVVLHIGLEDPSGTPVAEVVAFETPVGVVVTPVANVTQITNA